MRRRQFILAGAVLTVPMLVPAQARRRRIAWLSSASGRASSFLEAFKDGLRELGNEDGRNIEISAYLTDGTPGRTEEMVHKALASGSDLIVSQGVTVRVLYNSKPQVPVVFAFSGDPVDAGFVQSLARPGGNMTGMTFLSLELVGKRIQQLKELLPQMKRVAVLANPLHPGEKRERNASEGAARVLGLEVAYFPVTTAAEIEPAMLEARRAGCSAVDVYPDALMASESARIGSIAERERLPTISGWAVFAENGMLLSYGPNEREVFRRIAAYAGKILRGAHPADLPVELPTSIESVVNLRTARALGLTIPQSMLLRADRVIE